ncbi:MAG: IS66 family transposase, partial [Pseudomonadota bacterium]
MDAALDQLPDDIAALKAIILSERAEAAQLEASVKAYEGLVQALKVRIAKLRRQKFGRSSEKISREIEQLELALEALEVKVAADDTGPADEEDDAGDVPSTRSTPRRHGKPRISDDAPHERNVLDPGETCPECGGTLRLLGEDISEILEFVAAKLKVVETVRLKKSCRACETIVQPAAPTRPIPRGMAGPGLLAHILVAKFDDHLPLYRQGEIFARLGADIPRSTLIDWCGQATRALRPLADKIKASVFSATRLHADDTPIRVLDPKMKAAGKERGVKEGRIWTYVRDDRPWSGEDPPAVAYFFAPDKRGEHPQKHLEKFTGILQADAYRGFEALYEPGADGVHRVREAACWAHLRRDFHDVWKSTGSEIAKDALDQIGKFYDIERAINGQPADRRHAIRQEKSRPLVQAFRDWLDAQVLCIPTKGDLAKAMQYALNRWPSFKLFLDDGRVAIDNNAAERAIKPVVIGRKNSHDRLSSLAQSYRRARAQGMPDLHGGQRQGAEFNSTVAQTLIR